MGQLPVTGRDRGDERQLSKQQPRKQQPRKQQPSGPDERPVLPRVAESERDEAWGDRPRSAERDADWYHKQRPPHHE